MRLVSCLFAIVAFTSACGIMPPKMRDTNKPATPDTFDQIVANAEKAGYKAERSASGARDGKYFWYAKASRDGGTIYYTKNNSTSGVAFACNGGPLDDADACDKAGMAILNGQS